MPVSKQTAGGVAGAVVGSVLAGPVGAVVGGIAGTMMGNRAAKGKTLVSSGTMKGAKNVVKAVEKKLPSLKTSRASLSLTGKKSKGRPARVKVTASKAAKPRKRKQTRATSRKSS